MDGAALSREFAKEGQRDDALATTGTTRHDDDRLRVRRPGPVHFVQDEVEGDLLLVKQHELLAVADLGGRHRQQLPARSRLHAQQPIGRVDTGHVRVQPRAEEVQEAPLPFAGEQANVTGLGPFPEVEDRGLRRIVQVGHRHHVVLLPVEAWQEVEQVVAVAGHLIQGVQQGARTIGIDHDQAHVVLVGLRRTPLLELDEDVRGLTGPGIVARQHRVNTLAGQR